MEKEHHFPAIDRALLIIKARRGFDEATSVSSLQTDLSPAKNPISLMKSDSSGTHEYQSKQKECYDDITKCFVATTTCELAKLALEKVSKKSKNEFQKVPKIVSTIAHNKGVVLSKALGWCKQWHALLMSFYLIKDFSSNRQKIRRRFQVIISRVKDPHNAKLKFNKKMARMCINRLGKHKLSLLYEAWNLKRKYFVCWLTSCFRVHNGVIK